MNLNWTKPSSEKSEELYKIADEVAARANESAKIYGKANEEYEIEKTILEKWDNIMSNSYVTQFTIAFVIICVLEYAFSYEIYRDILPIAPWIIGFGFIVISIVISEFLVGVLNRATIDRRLENEKKAPDSKGKPESDIRSKVIKHARLLFIFGIVGFIVLGVAIFFVSKQRVDKELGAHLRENPFGIQDTLPVIFYVLEVLTGLFVFYIFKRIMKILVVKKLKEKSEQHLNHCRLRTNETCEKFDEALKLGYNPIMDNVSDNIRLAFYRNKHMNLVQQHISYIEEPRKKDSVANFEFKNSSNAPIVANVTILTEYKNSQKGATDKDTGKITLNIPSFPNDQTMKLLVEIKDSAGTKQLEIDGPYACSEKNDEHFHRVII